MADYQHITASPIVSKYLEPGKPIRATVKRLDTVLLNITLKDEDSNPCNLTDCTVYISATDSEKTILYDADIVTATSGTLRCVVQPDIVGRYLLEAKVTSGNNDETTFFLGAMVIAWEDEDAGVAPVISSMTQVLHDMRTEVNAAIASADDMSMEVGAVSTGDAGSSASVSNSGTIRNMVLDFAIPQGIKGVSMRIRGAWASGASYVNDATYIDIVTLNGSSYACKLSHTSAEANMPPNETNWQKLSEKGDWGTMTVGTVTTGAAGSDVVITNVGTDTDAILDIAIPTGSTFTPSVSSAGILSWTNDGGLSNPENKSLFPTGALARQVMVSDGLGGVTWQYIGDMAIKGGI